MSVHRASVTTLSVSFKCPNFKCHLFLKAPDCSQASETPPYPAGQLPVQVLHLRASGGSILAIDLTQFGQEKGDFQAVADLGDEGRMAQGLLTPSSRCQQPSAGPKHGAAGCAHLLSGKGCPPG